MRELVEVNLQIDNRIKKEMERVCFDLGLSIEDVFLLFAKEVAKQKRIPFDIKEDLFNSKSNITYLEKKLSDYKKGKINFEEHDLIED